MTMLDLTTALAGLRHTSPQALMKALTSAADPRARDVVLYLVDFEQEILQAFVDGSETQVLPEEPVSGTLAGRAFVSGETVTADREDGCRVWVPVFEHSARTGVLALTIDEAEPELLAHCETLGILAGLLVAGAARYTDLVHVRRRGRSMGLAASMQWDLLPPLTMRAEQVVVAGILEPAYEVAGDSFDHAINGDRVDVAVFDGMGHGIAATMLSTLAIGTYRHQRRENKTLPATLDTIENAILQQFGGDSFVTGVLVRLDLVTGQLELVNAGHPRPLLLRGRRVVGEIPSEPTPPFGLGAACEEPDRLALEPGDIVVLYTDGITEGRAPDGQEFGTARLVDFLEREAASEREPEEVLRRLARAVLDHQGGMLRDDATMVLLRWDGPSADLVPKQGPSG